MSLLLLLRPHTGAGGPATIVVGMFNEPDNRSTEYDAPTPEASDYDEPTPSASMYDEPTPS